MKFRLSTFDVSITRRLQMQQGTSRQSSGDATFPRETSAIRHSTT